MSTQTETAEGYVVDVACIRKYPRDELLARSREHTRACGLEGHCAESGYGLVDEQGRLALLDAEATPKVLAAIRSSDHDKGIRLRATRQMASEQMQTSMVEEVR